MQICSTKENAIVGIKIYFIKKKYTRNCNKFLKITTVILQYMTLPTAAQTIQKHLLHVTLKFKAQSSTIGKQNSAL